jgi:SlyX protein
MTDDTQNQLVDLQIRVTHQEAAIETLTQNYLAQEKQLLMLGKQLQDMKSMLREVMPSLVVPQAEETPPPHY